jgi:DNA polymerase III subunit epsilon
VAIITIGDLETTGFVASKGHRIVEMCFQMYDLETRQLLRSISKLVNPLRDIPADASRVHGIYIEDLQDAPTWEQAAPIAGSVLRASSCFVAHNVDFDAPFLGEELLRVNQTIPDVPLFCTMKNGRWATPNGKNPKLAELCWALDIDYDPGKAHRAEYDVERTAAALWKGLDAGLYRLPI